MDSQAPAIDNQTPVEAPKPVKEKKPRTEKQLEAFKKCLETRKNKIEERKKLAAAQVQASQTLAKAAAEGTFNVEMQKELMKPFQEAAAAQSNAVERAAPRSVKRMLKQQKAAEAASSVPPASAAPVSVNSSELENLRTQYKQLESQLQKMQSNESMAPPEAIQKPRKPRQRRLMHGNPAPPSESYPMQPQQMEMMQQARNILRAPRVSCSGCYRLLRHYSWLVFNFWRVCL